MHTIALEIEQQQRIENDLAAYEHQINRETDLYSEGKFDGIIGDEPTQIESQSYWEGYQVGLRKYWEKRKGIEIATEF